jgi:molybdopterin-guanine dinucleotide biosynthesis protein A
MSGFAAIVLAGGGGRRLGDPAKPERLVGGVPMLRRVLAAVADAAPLVVVGPPRLAPLLPPGATLTLEDPPGGGPVAAVAAGLAALGPTPAQVALLAADLPFLTADVVARLREGATSSGAVLVDEDDRPQWLCGVWDGAALSARLGEFGDPAGGSLRDLLTPLYAARVAATLRASGPPPYFDCDTEEDLHRADGWARTEPHPKPSAQEASPQVHDVSGMNMPDTS